VRSALVTGASRGIGHGIAHSLARQGYALTITARSRDELAALVPELLAAGAPEVLHHAADMADRGALRMVVAAHRAKFSYMNALILSAGVGTAGPVESLPLHRFDRTLEVNLASVFVLIQHALPLLRVAAADDPQHGSRVIALASIAGVYAEPGLAAYGASKAALVSLMETLNAEESGHGVMATAIAPGYVDTEMSAWVTDSIPARSMLPVADVVAVAEMLLALGPRTSITRIVMSRSGTSGHAA
jgi:NAD(P)-dependent dehydrogenase (short-subunit alcohol dehydrogenase family)